MNIKSITRYILTCILAITFYGCSSDLSEITDLNNVNKEQTCKMILKVDCPTFMDEFGTRAENGRWEEGDKVYIHISSTVYGVGIYQDGEWVYTYSGNLSNINSAPCSLYYIKGDCESSDNQLFTMNEKSAIYGTTSGVYSYFAGELTISATLRPLTSRMRFKGTANTQFVLSSYNALKYYHQLDVTKDQLTIEAGKISLTVNTDGYTDYIYVMAEEDVTLSLDITSVIYSNKKLSKSLFSAGATGYIEIPSSESFEGWTKKDAPKAILVDGQSFNSIIKRLSNGDSDLGSYNRLIKAIVFDYNSSVSDGEIISVSKNFLDVPIYANFKNDTIIISTQAPEITATDMSHMFSGCGNLTSIDLSGFDTQNVTNMSLLFDRCFSLTTLDLSGFDTRNVTSMAGMFMSCSRLTTLDLSGFDTRNVTSMVCMFMSCSRLTTLDLSGFDTRNLEHTGQMFEGCTYLTTLNISGFNTQNVGGMRYMFKGCTNLTTLDLSGFNTQNVTDMGYMFEECTNLTTLDLSGFNTQNVKYMQYMFNGCRDLATLDLSGFNTQNVTDMRYMFNGCRNLATLDLSGFNTHNVTDMRYMFNGCRNLATLDLSRFNTQNVTYMWYMFADCRNMSSLKLGTQFTLSSSTKKSDMFDSFTQDAGRCTISCTEATQNAISEGTGLVTDYITWDILH